MPSPTTARRGNSAVRLRRRSRCPDQWRLPTWRPGADRWRGSAPPARCSCRVTTPLASLAFRSCPASPPRCHRCRTSATHAPSPPVAITRWRVPPLANRSHGDTTRLASWAAAPGNTSRSPCTPLTLAATHWCRPAASTRSASPRCRHPRAPARSTPGVPTKTVRPVHPYFSPAPSPRRGGCCPAPSSSTHRQAMPTLRR